jgi:WS/DGAT/MGAT family acyltransferase
MAKRLRALSGLDATFLYLEASGTPMHVGSLILLEAPEDRGYDFHAALIDLLRERLPRAPALRRVLYEAPLSAAHPIWRELPEIDVAAQVDVRRLPKPGRLRQLEQLAAKLHAEMLPRDRPLWRFVVVNGLADGRLALYTKIHHALLDGQGGIALAQALLDLEPRRPRHREADEAARIAEPTTAELARTALKATWSQLSRMVRAIPQTVKLAQSAGGAGELIERLRDSVLIAPKTPFNVQIGPRRDFVTQRLPLAELKGVAKAQGVSLNDVVMAVCSSALRAWLKKRRVLPRKSLVAAMPISLRQAGDGEANNQVSMAQCELATHKSDPLVRLFAIAQSTGAIKQRVANFRGLIPTDFPGLAAPLWASGLSRLWGRGHIAERLPALANVVISNVPGPPVTLYLAGAKVAAYFPVSIVTHGFALNITLNSYAGFMEFGLIADPDAVDGLTEIAAGLRHGLTELMECEE